MMDQAPHRQIPLDFITPPPPSLGNFVCGRNAELLARLSALDFPAVLYVWGDEGCGKSHLVRACASLWGASIVTADDAQDLDALAQESLFDAFNATLNGGPKLVVAGNCPPLQLQLREDLRTRLGAGLVYEVLPLSDDEKQMALVQAARERGLVLPEDFSGYLLTHFRRDMRSLMSLLDAFDRLALERKRAPNLALLRECMKYYTEARP